MTNIVSPELQLIPSHAKPVDMLTLTIHLQACVDVLGTIAWLATFSSCTLLAFMYGMHLLEVALGDEDEW